MSSRVSPEERRIQIIEAALRCFARTGYNGTSMSDIVRETGLSKGTLYWYFPGKRELFMAAFDTIMMSFVPPVENLLDASISPSDRLRLLAAIMGQALAQEDEFLTLPVNFLFEIWQDDDFFQHYRKMLQDYFEIVKKIVEEGIASGEFRTVDVNQTAWGILALLEGVLLYGVAGIITEPAQHMKTMMELTIAGMAKQRD